MRKLFTFISLIAAIMSYAQTTQTGLVQEYNERAKKTPLAGVELNVRSAANTVSDKNGKFSLKFLTLKPGEKVNVRRIEKLGYEIFNKEAVEQWNINPKTPFVIIMCKADRFKKIRDNYERVSSESYARQLKKEEAALAKLKKDGKLKEREYEQKLIELRENYDKQLDNLENYVDRFSRIDLSEISSVEQEIIGLVQEGKIEEAIAKYEEQNFVTKYKQEVDQLKEISSAIDQLSDAKAAKEQSRDSLYAAIDRQIETLRLAGGTDNINKIEVILHDVAYSDTTATVPMWKYLDFMASQNKYRKIEDAFNTYFNQDMPNHDRIKGMELRVRSFINMADYSGHESLFSELDSLLDFEVKQDSNRESQFDNAKLYFRIGGFYMESDQAAKALPYFQKSVELLSDSIVFPLINEDLGYLNTYLLSNIGYAYAHLKLGNRKVFEQTTLKLKDLALQQMSRDSTNTKNLKIILSIVDVGQHLTSIKHYEDAEVLYKYAQSVYEAAIPKNPAKYLPLMANLYMLMGNLYSKTDKFSESEACYLKALEYNSSFKSDLPRQYKSYQQKVFNNLSALYHANDSIDKALEYAVKSYSISLDFYNDEPKYYQSHYLTALRSLAKAYDGVNAIDSAEYYYKKAYDLNKSIFKETGEVNIEDFWRKSIDLPFFYFNTSQFQKAIPELSEVISTGESFITSESPYYSSLQSIILFLGMSHRFCGNYDEAKTILGKYIKQNPAKSIGYHELAKVCAHMGNKKEAVKNLKTAIKCDPDVIKEIDENNILFQYLNEI